MRKRILVLILWLAGPGACLAQSINNQNPVVIGVDGSNTTGAKVLTLPQVQSTPLGTPTPQTSAWYQLNGNGAAQVEFSTNTFTGTYSVQVSNNLTPVSTPGTNIYTITQDTATYAAQLSETHNWSYMVRGWRYIRFLATPATENTGTLNFQVRLFGNGVSAGDANRTYGEGVPWKSRSELISPSIALSSGTYYYDYKTPQQASGIGVFTNAVASGTVTLTTTICFKDPISGGLQSIAVGTPQTTTSLGSIFVHAGYASPYPVATPPAGFTYVSMSVPQDIVVKDVVQGSGTITCTQSAVPIQ